MVTHFTKEIELWKIRTEMAHMRVKLAEFARLEERVAILERWIILLRNQEKSRRNRELMHEVETDD